MIGIPKYFDYNNLNFVNMFFSNSKKIFYIISAILCAILLFLLFKPNVNKQFYISLLKNSYTETFHGNLTEEAKKCYIKILNDWKKGEQTAWLEIANLVKACTNNIINFIPYLVTSPQQPEHKYYMVPKIQYINDSCSVITFGVGGDIEAETHIQMVLPQCTFLGFDPNKDYEKYFTVNLKGNFIQTAVGGKNEKSTIMKLTKKDGFKPAGNTQIKSAAELIEKYHGKDKIVDILNIDVEGSEYGIFEQLYKDQIFQNICQINVEFHPVWYHDTGYSFHQVMDILINLTQEGTFLWIKSDVHSSQFFPSYFVNIKKRICIEKYLKGRLL